MSEVIESEQESEAVADRLREQHLAEIQKLERECELLEAVWNNAKLAAKEAKESYEGAVAYLRGKIRKGPNPQLDFQFDEASAADESWRSVPITQALKLSESQREKLSDAGVETVGEFEDLRGGRNRDYPRGLSDLPKVGQATIDKWEQQVLDWLAVNQPAEPPDTVGELLED